MTGNSVLELCHGCPWFECAAGIRSFGSLPKALRCAGCHPALHPASQPTGWTRVCRCSHQEAYLTIHPLEPVGWPSAHWWLVTTHIDSQSRLFTPSCSWSNPTIVHFTVPLLLMYRHISHWLMPNYVHMIVGDYLLQWLIPHNGNCRK